MPAPRETLEEIFFPFGGVDLSSEFEMQLPGTTPTGKNVRAFEPGTQRQRGGSRPGLVQQIPAQVNGTALIQLIDATCVTTDPSGFGGSVYGPQGPGPPGGFIPPVGGSPGDPNAGGGGDGSGGNGGFGQTFNDNRPGDRSHFQQRHQHQPIRFVQAMGTGGGTGVPVMVNPTNAVGTGDLLLLGILAGLGGGQSGIPAIQMIQDSTGNGWLQISNVLLLGVPIVPFTINHSLYLWYTFALAGVPLTITITPQANSAVAASFVEYANVLGLDSSFAQQGSGFNATTGTLGVTQQGDLLVGVLDALGEIGGISASSGLVLPDPPFTERAGPAGGLGGVEFLDLLGVNASRAVTASLTPADAVNWGMIGASFKRR